MSILHFLLLALSLQSLVSSSSVPGNFDYYDEDTETYYYQSDRKLITTKFNNYNHYANQPYVANGFIGTRISNLGFGFTYDQNANLTSSMLENGWPLFNKRFAGAFIAGFFDAQKNTTGTNFAELLDDGGYESIISVVPQWTDLSFELVLDDATFSLDPRLTNDTEQMGNITNYQQELNMWNGVVTTSYTWLNLIDFNISIVAHREVETLGLVNLQISTNSSETLDLKVVDKLDFQTAQRCSLNETGHDEDGMFISVFPEGINYKAAAIYSVFDINGEYKDLGVNDTSADSVSAAVLISLDESNPSTITKFVGIVSDDLLQTNSSEDVFKKAKQTALEASSLEAQDLLEEHEQSWKEVWSDSRVEITLNPYLTLAAEASVYHLLSNARSSNNGITSALSVGGLSSDSYGGMVFWDSDLWMLPSLIPISPDISKSISSFRYSIHNQSRVNAETHGYNGSAYSWTAGRFGNCTGTGPCFDYEYHLNVAICYSYWKMYLAGAIDDLYLEEYGWPIIEDTATFFEEYVQWNDTLNKYTTHNLTDPDEYANFKNNAAYTAVGISMAMKWAIIIGDHLGLPVHDKWKDVMENMYLPVSKDNVTLEFDTMNSSIGIKQADVVLISFIDDQDDSLIDYFDYDTRRSFQDLLYYSEHQSSQGPAMTFPVFAAVSQKLNDIGCGSQTYLQKSIEPFLRFPFGQLSEQNNDDYDSNGGTHPAFPFLTGHGGILQSYYYGMTGLRFSYNVSDQNDNYGTINKILHFDPTDLPLFDGDLNIYGFKYLNESLDISIKSENATVKHNGLTNNTITIYVNERNPKSGYYQLEPNTTLNIPVYITDFNFENSLTECSSTLYQVTKGEVGDVLESIIDGDNSTKWQAISKDKVSRVLIDLTSIETFSKGNIVWGSRPAREFSISIIPSVAFIDESYLTSEYLNDSSYFNITSVLKSQEVEITSPFDVSNVEVEIKPMNYTGFNIGASYSARYVVLDVDGVLDDDEDISGAQIAEFSLFS